MYTHHMHYPANPLTGVKPYIQICSMSIFLSWVSEWTNCQHGLINIPTTPCDKSQQTIKTFSSMNNLNQSRRLIWILRQYRCVGGKPEFSKPVNFNISKAIRESKKRERPPSTTITVWNEPIRLPTRRVSNLKHLVSRSTSQTQPTMLIAAFCLNLKLPNGTSFKQRHSEEPKSNKNLWKNSITYTSSIPFKKLNSTYLSLFLITNNWQIIDCKVK